MDILPLTEITMQPPPLGVGSPEVTTWRDIHGAEAVFCGTYGDWHWSRVVGAGSYRFPVGAAATGVAGEVVPEPGADGAILSDSYYRTVVPLALQVYGHEVLHGSAIALPQGVVALCAQPESGKSTIAFAMQKRGHEVVADDAVVISAAAADESAAAPVTASLVQRLPFALRLRPQAAEHFGSRPRDEVAVGALEATAGAEYAERGPLPLAAVVKLDRRPATEASLRPEKAPTQPRSSPELVRLSPAEAFGVLLAEAKAFSLSDEARRRRLVANYLRLAATVPVYQLSYASGLENLAAICDRLETLGRAPRNAAEKC